MTRNDYNVKSATGDLSHRYVNPRRSAIISAVINGRVNLRDKQAERGRARWKRRVGRSDTVCRVRIGEQRRVRSVARATGCAL